MDEQSQSLPRSMSTGYTSNYATKSQLRETAKNFCKSFSWQVTPLQLRHLIKELENFTEDTIFTFTDLVKEIQDYTLEPQLIAVCRSFLAANHPIKSEHPNKFRQQLLTIIGATTSSIIRNLQKMQQTNESVEEYWSKVISLYFQSDDSAIDVKQELVHTLCRLKHIRDIREAERTFTITNVEKEVWRLIELGILKMKPKSNNERNTNNERHNNSEKSTKQQRTDYACYKCGGQCKPRSEQCPAKNADCKFCGKTGHWERVCLAKKKGNNNNKEYRNQGRKEQANLALGDPFEPCDIFGFSGN